MRINKKTMDLISSEDQHIGTCILFKSSSELMEELEVLKKVEQKNLINRGFMKEYLIRNHLSIIIILLLLYMIINNFGHGI